MVFAPRFNSAAWLRGWCRHLSRTAAAIVLISLAASQTALASQSALAKDKGSSENDSQEAPADAQKEASESAETSASLSTAEAAPDGEAGNEKMKPTIMFFDMGFRSDISLLYQRTTVGRFQEQEDFDVKSFGPMMHVGILTKIFWKLRLGAALGYGFNYKMTERLTEFEEEERIEPETWILGQIYTGDIRLEFSEELVSKLWLVATPRGGLQAVIPGEHLLRETETYEGAYNVRQGPQLGIIGGFEIGARYLLLDWLAVRMSGGYDYYTQGLLKAKRKSETVNYTALWRMRGARVGGNLGVEAVF